MHHFVFLTPFQKVLFYWLQCNFLCYLIDTKVTAAFENLNKCSSAMLLENEISSLMQSTFCKSNNSMILLEENLLSLASSELYDDIFYCNAVKFIINNKVWFVARYFESGGFKNCFLKAGNEKLRTLLNVDCLLPYSIFTEEDIGMEKIRISELFMGHKKEG